MWSGQPRDNLGTTSGQPRDNPTSFLIKNGSFDSFCGLLMDKNRLDGSVLKQILTGNKDKCFWTKSVLVSWIFFLKKILATKSRRLKVFFGWRWIYR